MGKQYNPNTPKMKTVVMSTESMVAMREKVQQMATSPIVRPPDGATLARTEFSLKHKTRAATTYHLHANGDIQSVFYQDFNREYVNGCLRDDYSIIFFSIIYTDGKKPVYDGSPTCSFP